LRRAVQKDLALGTRDARHGAILAVRQGRWLAAVDGGRQKLCAFLRTELARKLRPRVRYPALVLVAVLVSAGTSAAAEQESDCRPGAAVVADSASPAADLLRLAELTGAAPVEPGVIRRARRACPPCGRACAAVVAPGIAQR
jgi:hypothetical protein